MFDSTARFEKALVRLIQSFNYIDTNIGLCISHLLNPSDPTKSYPSLAKMTAEKRIKKLKNLLEDTNIAVSENARTEFMMWYESAVNVRNIRNRYVHGNWEFLPLRHEHPISVSAPPWMRKPLGPLASESMSLSQLEIIVDEVEDVFQKFMQFRRRFKL